MEQTKITIEITKEGWTTTVNLKGKTFVEKSIATPTGAEGIEGNFEKEDEMPEEVYDALESFFMFDCMSALQSIEE